MDNVPPQPPIGLSSTARDFIIQSQSASWEPMALDPQSLAVLRAENTAVAMEGWTAVCAQDMECCDVEAHRQELVGGVPCLWVEPRKNRLSTVVLLYIFGGGFIVGCPEDDLSIISRLANLSCLSVCAPRYRLAPEHPFPAARDDVRCVYDALSLRFSSLVVVGESAGGNLALSLVLSSELRTSVSGVVLMSPWIDLTHSGDSTNFGLDPTLSKENFLIPASIAYAPPPLDVGSPEISPLFAEVPLNFPPTLITTATRDCLLSDCVRLAKKLRLANCNVELRVEEGLFHVFEWYPKFPEARESLREISKWISCVINNK